MNTAVHPPAWRLLIVIMLALVAPAGAQPAAPLLDPPASTFIDGWKLPHPSEAPGLIARLRNQLAENDHPFPDRIVEIRTRTLSCYDDARIVKYLDDRDRLYVTIQARRTVALLGSGNAGPLHEFNRQNPPLLTSENAGEYARLFFSVAAGDQGRFHLVESSSFAKFMPDEETKERALEMIPPRLIESVPGVFRLEGVVLFGQNTFTSTIEINRDGNVSMLDDKPLATDLDVGHDAFSQGALRSVRQDGQMPAAFLTQPIRGAGRLEQFREIVATSPQLPTTSHKLRRGDINTSPLRKIDLKRTLTSHEMGIRGHGQFAVHTIELVVPEPADGVNRKLNWAGVLPENTPDRLSYSWYLVRLGSPFKHEPFFTGYYPERLSGETLSMILGGGQTTLHQALKSAGEDDPRRLVRQSTDMPLEPGTYRLWIVLD